MKTVIITGSARGFGYAMTEEFLKKGYNVVNIIGGYNNYLLEK